MEELGHVRSLTTKGFVPERIGAEISRRYDINKDEIGSGGYGKVFVAKDRMFENRKVAIKKVVVLDPEKKKAFAREVKIMKELDHPNICKLLETYEQQRMMFLVMEYCEGREVFDRIMDLGQITEQSTADIVKQATSALKYAHKRGIAHRDMKPENLCFCSDDPDNSQIKVIDWGLGFYFGQARMKSAVGSLTYAAPEVLDARANQPYSSACDLWSLGIVAYVMICGRAPFWGSYSEQLRRMRKEQFPMSDATWQATSKDAKDFIRGLMKSDPRKRMSIDAAWAHPWLVRTAAKSSDVNLMAEVLQNMKKFSGSSAFFSVCVASVARQLDHRALRDVHKVFCEMDTNGDGVLELQEVKAGFEKIYGADSSHANEVEEMFRKLDLDGSGSIDYTEFCAAGIGEHLCMQDTTLWAAFRVFDAHDDDGTVTVDELKQVLKSTDVSKAWSADVCSKVAEKIVSEFDQNGDGTVDFDEFVKVMRATAARHALEASKDASSQSERQAITDLEEAKLIGGFKGFDKAYATLERERSKGNGIGSSTSRRSLGAAECGGCGAGTSKVFEKHCRIS
mmetsp:Transcript_74472/g.206837  ORF Transcript_74472/g.206837 Transcript_74472/m.206837 type:complete len:566 (-) Transcript_74472:157-1854(-)|eukprot:CAMPEP_0117501632 /NCGR_PEP_ID=MMETSP0784-20121206/23399_1 /TAXON_ID=39447 /ORGANISM="" /LENGTH=565 /DNA_ID=CAMNT_0005296893 /DNA_START=87 /DNA_END=1784 /DNA_ORIENTATION=-